MASCDILEEGVPCADGLTAFDLKVLGICAILGGSALGVFLPLIGSRLMEQSSGSSAKQILSTAKSFGAGVILATGFIHILPSAQEAFDHPCVPPVPWKKFPFYTCIAMMAALATLILELLSMSFFDQKNGVRVAEAESKPAATSAVPAAVVTVDSVLCTDDEDRSVRKVVISQVLELGIISHSVIIGVTLGVSKNPCTIRPLIIALSFHQFFEGIALGSCICEARFGQLKSVIMACAFAVTTPLGISLGMGIASGYKRNSASALIVEGVFDSASAGILIYLALVDLIAAEFLGDSGRHLDRAEYVVSSVALFGGAAAMAALAMWA